MEISDVYIYMLINSETKRAYIGRSERPELRHRQHINALRSHYHSCKVMQMDFDEYGEDSFSFVVLQKLKPGKRLRGAEQSWMRRFDTYNPVNGYNYADASTGDHRKHNEKLIDVANILGIPVSRLLK